MKVIALLVPLFTIQFTQCANILGVFPAPGYSQYILAEVLMKELASRGHQVTVISPFRPKNEPKNYKTVLTDDIFSNLSDDNLFDLDNINLFESIMFTYRFGNDITESTLANQDVQKLMHSKEKFDLVIVEHFFNDAMQALAHHFKTPLVLLASMGPTEWNVGSMGTPFHPSINAFCYGSYTNDMNFIERAKNTMYVVFDYFYRHFVYNPQQQKYLRKYISQDIDYYEVINNASVMLLNSHVTTSQNALLQYNVVEIGGFHVVNDKLSDDVQNYLDKATDGAILFSLGSNLNSSDLSQKTIDAIFRVFGKLKEKILWKFEKDLSEKPPNLYISKWFDQRAILAHPNIKLFITHGGMLSTTEAIYNGVPMVGIPVFADQKMNMARAKRNGIATFIYLPEISETTLFGAINETLNDPSYRENMNRMSELLRDRPMKPIDLAIYWIEYVIRHKGFYFRGPSLKLYWFQLYMFDIFLCGMIVIFFPLIILLFRRRTKNETVVLKKKRD